MKLLLFSALLGFATSAVVAEDAAKTDQKALQGTWTATASKGFSKDVSADDLRTLKLTFRDQGIQANYNKKKAAATFQLNLKKAGPSEIDVTVSEGSAAVKGKKLNGIYLLEGDTLKVSFRDPGKARPSDFTVTDQPGIYTIWFKREKP